MSTLPEESVYSRPVFLHRGHSLTCWQDFEQFCNFGDVWFFCSLLSTTLHLPELEIPGLCYSRHSVMGNRKQIQYWEISKTYPLMGKFICVIICIAICLISWICNSWIRILAGCLLCTAHCLWFPAYFQAFLSYCLLLLVSVVTRECACAMGQVHGALGPLGPSWPRAQGHGGAAGRMGEARPTEPRPWEVQKIHTISCFTNIEPCQLWRKTYYLYGFQACRM